MTLRPFHLAFPVHDLDAAHWFWGETMGCPEGRSSHDWIDFDFFDHQIVAHRVAGMASADAGGNAAHGVSGPASRAAACCARGGLMASSNAPIPPVLIER